MIPNTAPCEPREGDTIMFTLNGTIVEETASWSLGGSPATSGYDPNVGIPLTAAATPTPTPEPTEETTPEPTVEPTPTPTPEPTSTATSAPTSAPTEEPTPTATAEPTSSPTPTVTPTPTASATSTPASSATVTIRPIGDPANGDDGGGRFDTFAVVIVVLLVIGGIGVAIVLPRLRLRR